MLSEKEKECLTQSYMDAAYAYDRGNFHEAFVGFSKLVQSGNAMAATYLSNFYFRGEGVPRNVEKGIELLELAITLGDSQAAFNLGALYRSGDCGVPKDPEKSRRFFLLAKELGC